MWQASQVGRRLRFAQVGAALVCCASWAHLITDELPQEKSNQSWRTGPARYILTTQEDRAYKRLAANEKMAEFIQDFWARRDPSPETPENEFRDSFWRRVEEANDWFRERNREGWETDRGKILLTAGYPDERCGEGSSVEGWLYSRDFPSRMGVKNPAVKMRVTFTAAFARTGSGEYKAKPIRDLSDGESLLLALGALEPSDAAKYAMGSPAMPPAHSGHEDPNHLVIDALTRDILSLQ